ncbi:MAG: hypothetical protein MZV64_48990 [Ignavibacteriales bacterium]|nr:hypothetical protein [Ignavibacteriales bacterium]
MLPLATTSGTDSLVVHRHHPGSTTIVLTTADLSGEPIRVAATRDRNFTYIVGYPLGGPAGPAGQPLSHLPDPHPDRRRRFRSSAGSPSPRRPCSPSTRSPRSAPEASPRRTWTRRSRSGTSDDEIGRLTATINDMIRRVCTIRSRRCGSSPPTRHTSSARRSPIMRGEIELALRSTKTPGGIPPRPGKRARGDPPPDLDHRQPADAGKSGPGADLPREFLGSGSR